MIAYGSLQDCWERLDNLSAATPPLPLHHLQLGGRSLKHHIVALATLAVLTACGETPVSPKQDALASGGNTRVQLAAEPVTVGFNTVGAATFTVPAAVTALSITAVGGGGGGSIVYAGGSGARVTTTLSVTPGQVLELFVGATSAAGTNWSVGGGGSSSISSGGIPLAIAGGGGGAGRDRSGGSAGGPNGAGGDGISGGVVSCGRRCSTSGTGGMGGAGGIGGAGGTSTGG